MGHLIQRLLKKSIVLFLIFGPVLYGHAQIDSATGVGSGKFKISGGKTFWMGYNYRKEWTTPIKAPPAIKPEA